MMDWAFQELPLTLVRDNKSTVVVSEEVVKRLTGASNSKQQNSNLKPVSNKTSTSTTSKSKVAVPEKSEEPTGRHNAVDNDLEERKREQLENERHAKRRLESQEETKPKQLESPQVGYLIENGSKSSVPETFQQMLEREKAMQLILAAELDEKSERIAQKVLSTRPHPHCSHVQSAVIDCYSNARQQPLLCAEQARQFAECVEQHRLELLAKPAT